MCGAISREGRLEAQGNHVDGGLRDRRNGLPRTQGQDSLHLGQHQGPASRFHGGRAEQVGVAGFFHGMPGRYGCLERPESNFLFGCQLDFATVIGPWRARVEGRALKAPIVLIFLLNTLGRRLRLHFLSRFGFSCSGTVVMRALAIMQDFAFRLFWAPPGARCIP